MSIKDIKNISKFTFIIMSVLTAACGGGGGGSDNPNPDGPGTTPTNPNITPLTEQQCINIADYVWVNDSCTIEGNESVTNVAAIEKLPEQNREELLNWIKSINKKTEIEPIFPSSRADPSGEPGEIPNTYIDGNLLRDTLNGRSMLEDGGQYYLLGKVDLLFWSARNLVEYTESYQQNGNTIYSVDFKLQYDGYEGVILLFDKEVYRFRLVEKIFVTGHFGRAAQRDEVPYRVEPAIDQQLSTGEVNASFIMESFQRYHQPGADTQEAVASVLRIPDTDIDLVDVDNNSSAFSYKTDIAEDQSAYFNTNYSTLYALKTPLMQVFDGGTGRFSVTGFYKSSNLRNIGMETPDFLLSFENELQITTEQDSNQPSRYSISDQTVSFQAHSIVQRNTQEALDSVSIRNELIENSPNFQTLTAVEQPHSPSYQELVALNDEFVELADLPMPKAMMGDEDTKALFLGKAAPRYGSDQIPSTDQINALKGWADALIDLLDTQTSDSQESSTLATFIEQVPNDNAIAWQFYNNIATDFNTLVDQVSADNYPIYADDLLYTAVWRVYYNSRISDRSSDISDAINVANEQFAAPLGLAIRNFGNMTRRPGALSWSEDQIAVSNLLRTPELLTATNKANLIEHDELAAIYDLREFIPILYMLDNPQLANLPNKNTALGNLFTFAAEDRENIEEAYKFNTGIKQLASVVYDEEWSSEVFTRFKSVMSFMYISVVYTETLQCATGSLSERYDCLAGLGAYEDRISTIFEEGYLADYPGEENPYVANADKFNQAHQTTAQIFQSDLSRFLYLNSDFTDEITDGIWIDCTASQISAKVNYYSELADELMASITEYPDASTLNNTAVYNQQQQMQSDLRESLEDCTTI
jgi:hypothetical protein